MQVIINSNSKRNNEMVVYFIFNKKKKSSKNNLKIYFNNFELPNVNFKDKRNCVLNEKKKMHAL